jgi:hypothetical protein
MASSRFTHINYTRTPWNAANRIVSLRLALLEPHINQRLFSISISEASRVGAKRLAATIQRRLSFRFNY